MKQLHGRFHYLPTYQQLLNLKFAIYYDNTLLIMNVQHIIGIINNYLLHSLLVGTQKGKLKVNNYLNSGRPLMYFGHFFVFLLLSLVQ